MSIFRRTPTAFSVSDDSTSPAGTRPVVPSDALNNSWEHSSKRLALLGMRIWKRLTDPSKHLETVEDQLQARLLALMLLLALPITLGLGLVHSANAVAEFSAVPTVLMIMVQIVGYWLSRTRYYRVTISILLAAMLIGTLMSVALSYSPNVVLYLSFSALFAMMFLALWRALAVIVGINIFVIVGLPLLVPGDTLAAMATERSFVFTLAVFLSVSVIARHLSFKLIERQTQRLIAAEKDQAALAVERQRVQVLRQFVQNASHDIRTPLSSIRLSLELLDVTLYENQKPRLENLRQQTGHLERMLLDMLELSRLDATAQLERTPVDVVKLVTYVHGHFCEEALDFNHTFEFEPGADVLTLLGDDQYLERAVRSVVENALHFTNQGGKIVIRTYAKDGHAVIEVQDNGIGIGEHEIPLIFERFYRVDSARNTGNGGAGLGLAITKHIVMLHGGQIDVESTPGTGAIFRMVIPLADQTVLTTLD